MGSGNVDNCKKSSDTISSFNRVIILNFTNCFVVQEAVTEVPVKMNNNNNFDTGE